MQGEQASSAATIDRIVSAPVWGRFPALLTSVERWSELAGNEAANVVVSAVELGFDWISVRVSVKYADPASVDWLEFLVRSEFKSAPQEAIDHYTGRHLHLVQRLLIAREATGKQGEPYIPEDDGIPQSIFRFAGDVATMPTKSAPVAPAPAPKKPGRKPKEVAPPPPVEAKPASRAAPKKKPGRKPKAAAKAVAKSGKK